MQTNINNYSQWKYRHTAIDKQLPTLPTAVAIPTIPWTSLQPSHQQFQIRGSPRGVLHFKILVFIIILFFFYLKIFHLKVHQFFFVLKTFHLKVHKAGFSRRIHFFAGDDLHSHQYAYYGLIYAENVMIIFTMITTFVSDNVITDKRMWFQSVTMI